MVAQRYVAMSHITVAAEGVEALESAFRSRLGEVDAWPGFEGLEVLADVRAPGRYVMLTRWRSKDDFVAYMRSEAHDRSHARIPRKPSPPRAAGFDEFRVVAR